MERQTSSVKSNLVKFEKEGGEKMKKVLLFAALIALIAVPAAMAGQNIPGGGIKNSKHNLGTSGFDSGGVYSDGYAQGTSQICVFCHTPHNSDANKTRPLWVRATVSVGKLYSSITLDNKPSLAKLTVAKLCLSCHDGSVAPGVTGNNLGTSTNATLAGTQMIRTQYDIGNGPVAAAGDLSNDHPVGMTYDTAIDNGNANLRAIGGIGPQATWFKVVGGENIVDCSSCHELHNSTPNAKFLRVTRDSSGICRTCHNK